MGFEFEQGKFIVTHDIARVSVTIVLRIVNYMTLYTTSYCEYCRVEYKYYNLYKHWDELSVYKQYDRACVSFVLYKVHKRGTPGA